jgi:hypothetical protein
MSQAAPAATAPPVDARTIPPDAAAVGSTSPSPPIPADAAAAAALSSAAASPSRTPPSTVPSPPPAAPAACPPGPVRTSRRRRRRRRHSDPPYYVYGWTEAGRRGIGLVPGTAAHEYWLAACRMEGQRRGFNERGMVTDSFFSPAPGEMEGEEKRFNAGRASFVGGGDEEVVVWDRRRNIPGFVDLASPWWQGEGGGAE